MELWVKKIFVSSSMRFKPKHCDQVCFVFHHIYLGAGYQVGKNKHTQTELAGKSAR